MHCMERTEFSGELQLSERPKKVGLLGGTFNPPHKGHLYLAKQAYLEFGLDEIWLLPVGDPPHKREEVLPSKEVRLAMVELLAEERPYLKVSTLEMERMGYTYTVDTLRTLHKLELKPVRFYYIIGSDTLFELESWKDHQSVFKMTAFLCIPRPGDRQDRLLQKIEELKAGYGAEILLSRGQGPDISSTQIRTLLNEGQSARHLLTTNIGEFIEANHVYSR